MSVTEINICKTIARFGILAFFCFGILARCASVGTPQGGPRDSLPPKVVMMTPAFGTTNFKDKRITIQFNEYVQLKDQQKEFFTSPFMKKKPTLVLRGRGIQIDLKEDLDSNQTYSLNFGKSVVDNNEGNPYTGLRYVFSTGDHIDSLLMSGYTTDAMTTDTVGNVYILNQPMALPLSIATAAIIYIFPAIVDKPEKLIPLLDIISVGIYAATGADKALVYGFAPAVCIMMGFFTAVGGGMLRDGFMGVVPGIFQRTNFYAIAAIAGIALNAVLPGKDYEFGTDADSDSSADLGRY